MNPPRHERKLAGFAEPEELEGRLKLCPGAFRAAYPEREVNSLYLDTLDFAHLRDSVEGESQRRKVRVRWYGALEGPLARAQVEVKAKSGLAVTKEVHLLGPLDDLSTRTLREAFRRAPLPPGLRLELLSLWPAAVTRYRRRYLQAASAACRATIDWGLEWRAPRPGGGTGPATGARPAPLLELKYPPEEEPFAGAVASRLPLRVVRHSKYALAARALGLT